VITIIVLYNHEVQFACTDPSSSKLLCYSPLIT
jgi:hypothetical protein